jgi:hypothetical protein
MGVLLLRLEASCWDRSTDVVLDITSLNLEAVIFRINIRKEDVAASERGSAQISERCEFKKTGRAVWPT